MDFISNSFDYNLPDDVTGEERSLTVLQFLPIKIPVCVKDTLASRFFLIIQYFKSILKQHWSYYKSTFIIDYIDQALMIYSAQISLESLKIGPDIYRKF